MKLLLPLVVFAGSVSLLVTSWSAATLNYL